MAITYNFLKNVYLDLRIENSKNKLFIPSILVLLSIPLSYALNNIFLVFFIVIAAITFKKENFKLQRNLLPLILLYFLMALSLLWTLSFSRTFSALSKEIALLLIPLCFCTIKRFTEDQLIKILKYYSFGMVLFSLFYFAKSVFRFALSNDTTVFFYHELVTKDLNAIHVSVYMSVACFYFLSKRNKKTIDIICALLLTTIIFMLASKNVIIVFLLLVFLYFFFYSKISKKLKYTSIFTVILIFISLSFVTQIRERFLVEFKTNTTENTLAEGYGADAKVYNVSIKQAWNKEQFKANDFFPGTAFRVYQARIFFEMLQEDPIFFTGYGLNASTIKIGEKAKKYKVHEGYAGYNFHNQYIQNFAELGIFGLLFLLLAVVINIKKALVEKNFPHIAFAILILMLFLTESFLWRQRGVVYFTMMFCLFNTHQIFNANRKTI
jgi:O-antigen ligase